MRRAARVYAPLFATTTARRLVAASVAGRLAIGAFGLPLVLAAQQATGSFASAGIVVGGFSAGVALGAPLRGRLVDRRGSPRALPPLVAISGACLIALAALTGEGATPVAVLTALAALSGLTTPPLVAAMRLEWQRLLGGDAGAAAERSRRGEPPGSLLPRAYALESSLQTGVFVVGPLLSGAGIALAGARVSLALSGVLLIAGTLTFAALAAPPVTHAEGHVPRSPMRRPGVRVLVLVTLIADVALGVVDVAVPAFAQERGAAGAAGVLLALFAVGGVMGGLAFGARTWRSAPSVQLAAATAVSAALLALMAPVEAAVVLGALLLVSGAPSAAQWAAASVSLDRASGGRGGAEAFAWLSAANSIGVGLGSVLGGAIVEHRGTGTAFLAAAAAAALAAVTVLARRVALDGGETRAA